jgi:endoglucanase
MNQIQFKSGGLLKCNPIGIIKKVLEKWGVLLLISVLSAALNSYGQPVAIHGALSVSGNKVVNKNGQAVGFAGNSLFWCNYGWGGEKYYNPEVLTWLRNDWNSAIVRCAMGVETDGGYLGNKAGNKAKVKTVVDAAIANGMYVIIDWHTHHAEWNTSEAIDFFREMANTYGDKPNVIYEIYNEPINSSWSADIKPYAEKVSAAIRAIDPDNLIIVGTRFYSAFVNEPADDPIYGKNIAYTIHFYAGSHKQDYRDRCQYALNKGIALFATEWGTVNADGAGAVNEAETYAWMDFLNRNQISHCNWSINDKSEGASALNTGAGTSGNWSTSALSWSGSLVRNILRSYDYGKVKDEVSFDKAPIISAAKSSYSFTIRYSATQSRDLIVSFLNKEGSVLGTTKTQVSGSGEKLLEINLTTIPPLSGEYSYICEIRPAGGGLGTGLDSAVINNITLLKHDPLQVIEAESYAVMSGVRTETCAEGGQNVGYLEAGDWLSYSDVGIPVAGKYNVLFRVASVSETGVISLEKDNGQTVLETFAVPVTGSWQTWTTISREVDLPAGKYNLGLGIPTGGFNLNLFAIVPDTDPFPEITGLENLYENVPGGMHIYPMPARDFIQLTGLPQNSKISIINIQGEKVLETQSGKTDISILPAGTYFIIGDNASGLFLKE